MSVFIIGDTHLSGSVDKPMDVFGGKWENYTDKLKRNWIKSVGRDDTVVLAGDISWAMSLDEALTDFKFLESLPGRKIILKGNHDYWWNTVGKMQKFLNENDIKSIEFIYNNCAVAGDFAICGTRGWGERETKEDEKIIAREAGRLERSLISAPDGLEKIAVMHYPPLFENGSIVEFISIMQKYGVKRCYYGHLHAGSIFKAVQGMCFGIEFYLVSADSIDFLPVNI